MIRIVEKFVKNKMKNTTGDINLTVWLRYDPKSEIFIPDVNSSNIKFGVEGFTVESGSSLYCIMYTDIIRMF